MGFAFYGISFMLTRIYATSDDDETCSFDYSYLLIMYAVHPTSNTQHTYLIN